MKIFIDLSSVRLGGINAGKFCLSNSILYRSYFSVKDASIAKSSFEGLNANANIILVRSHIMLS